MCEILIKAVDATNADPVVDREGCYKKGFPVIVKLDNSVWGTKEALPNFILLKAPGLDIETAKLYMREWKFEFDWEILASNESGYRIRLYAANVSNSGVGGLTRQRVETWLNNHGAIFKSASTNEVIFDLPLTDPHKISEFKQELKHAIQRVWCRRRYYFDEAAVDQAIAAGGVVTLTPAQINTRLRDKYEE